MDYSSISGTPVYPMQRRAPGRNLNVPPAHGSVLSDFCPREAAPDVPMSVQHQKSLRASDPKFIHAAMQPTVAHSMQRHSARRMSPLRAEQEGYYESYYSPPGSPPPGLSSAYQVYKQNPADSVHMREQLDERTYEDIDDEEGEEEEEEEEEDEIEAVDYIPDLPQKERHLRTQEYYPSVPAREVSFCEPYVTSAQRRYSKSPVRSYDIQQPTSDGILPPRARSPVSYTRQQMSEPLHSRCTQSKPGKLTSRSCYDSEGRLYTRSRSPENDYYEGRRVQDYHLLGKPQREKLYEEMRQQREGEDLKQIFPSSEGPLLRHGNDESTKPSQQCPLSPRDCLNLAAQEDEYLKKLQVLFQEEASDVERLIVAKKAELERRNARNKSPVGTFHQGLNG